MREVIETKQLLKRPVRPCSIRCAMFQQAVIFKSKTIGRKVKWTDSLMRSGICFIKEIWIQNIFSCDEMELCNLS
jgi:hypothetical protein